jgi:hypothetical protein
MLDAIASQAGFLPAPESVWPMAFRAVIGEKFRAGRGCILAASVGIHFLAIRVWNVFEPGTVGCHAQNCSKEAGDEAEAFVSS